MKKYLRNLKKKALPIAAVSLLAVTSGKAQATITSDTLSAITDNTAAATTMAGGIIPFVALIALVGIAIMMIRKR